MKKKIVKIAVILIFVLMSSLNILYAAEVKVGNSVDETSWTKWTAKESNVIKSSKTIMATAISVVKIVAMGIAVIMLLMIAIKYMSASPEGKAEYKKSATAYVVGAVVLFAAGGILGIIESFADNLNKK